MRDLAAGGDVARCWSRAVCSPHVRVEVTNTGAFGQAERPVHARRKTRIHGPDAGCAVRRPGRSCRFFSGGRRRARGARARCDGARRPSARDADFSSGSSRRGACRGRPAFGRNWIVAETALCRAPARSPCRRRGHRHLMADPGDHQRRTKCALRLRPASARRAWLDLHARDRRGNRPGPVGRERSAPSERSRCRCRDRRKRRQPARPGRGDRVIAAFSRT